MALQERDILQLMARVGKENVLRSEADRIVYSTDVGSPPGVVDMLVNRKADAVVRCHDMDDVRNVAQYCIKHNIPMTPRAAATNALGGAVPKRAGVVLDMTSMAKRIEVDEAKMRVTVDAGVVIKDLQEKLLEVGLELPCYPTSANAATIGGFVAMDGHGIHATRAGNIGKWVREVEGVDLEGRPFRTRDHDDLEMLVGFGGSTGIITRVRLEVVEAQKDKPVVVSVKKAKQLQQLVEEVVDRFDPKHVMFHNSDFFALRAEAMGKKKNPFAGKHVAFLTFAEGDWNKISDDLEAMVARIGGEIADDKTAESEWDGRFFPIRAKVLGPSLVAGEVFVPTKHIAAYLKQLREKTWVGDLSVEGHVTDDGRVYFFIFTLDDERRPNYPLGWGTAARIVSLAKKFDGKAYHSGVWLQAQSKDVFGQTRYRRAKSVKKGDARNLFNPGMVFPLPAPVPEFVYKAKIAGPVPAPSLGLQLAAGDPVLMRIGGAMKYQRHKSVGVKAAAVAADMARSGMDGQDLGLFTDEIWGADLPSLQAIPNPQGTLPMTQTPRGKMVLAKAYVQSKVEDPWTLKPALDVADPDEDDAEVLAVCPDWKRYRPVLESLRRAVQAEGVDLDVQAVEIEVEEVETGPAEDTEKSGGMDKEEVLKMAKETPESEKAWVLAADCIVCNGCESACPTDAAIVTDIARVDRDLCIADGACFDACPTDAIRPGEEDESSSAGWPEGSRLAGKFGV